MSKLLLVRHGQASFGSQNYDQLSPLGRQQAQWLGQYFAETGLQPTRLISGDLTRHLQTAEQIVDGLASSAGGLPTIEQHTGWNEFDFQTIIQAYLAMHPDKQPTQPSAKAFFSLLRAALKDWSDDRLAGSLPETWSAFQQRVRAALDFSRKQTQDQTVLIISSGGAISMALQQIMGFDNATMINLNLQTRNTGVSEIYFNKSDSYLSCFNSVSHLDTIERRASITYA